MSGEKKVTDEANDPELNELLDSALKDFDKPVKPTAVKKEDASSTSTVASTEKKEEDVSVEDIWTEDFIKQAANQFQQNFEEIMQNGNSNIELCEAFKRMQTAAASLSETSSRDGASSDFESAINQALKDLSATTENLQNMANTSQADLAAMFGQATLKDDGDEMPFAVLPVMQKMIDSLMSKDFLYPAIKDIADRYPAWLDEKRSTLPPADLAKYEKQYEFMQKVCREFEAEKDDDSEEVKRKRSETRLALIDEMHNCGDPPKELFMGADGNPIPIPPNLSEMDLQNCSVM